MEWASSAASAIPDTTVDLLRYRPIMVGPLLDVELFDVSRSLIRDAFSAWRNGYRLMFALNAGVGVEHLAKAALARRQHIYIVEMSSNNFPSLVTLHHGSAGRYVKTVGLSRALARLQFLGVELRLRDSEIADIVDLRNEAAHLANRLSEGDPLIGNLGQLVEVLLADLGEDRSAFWGDLTGSVDKVLAERARLTDERVLGKLAEAEARHVGSFAGHPPMTRDALMRSIAERAITVNGPSTKLTCPVCELEGVARGSYDVEWTEEWDVDADGNGSRLGERWIHLDSFECPVCLLVLEGWDELDTAALPTREPAGTVRFDHDPPGNRDFNDDVDWRRGR